MANYAADEGNPKKSAATFNNFIMATACCGIQQNHHSIYLYYVRQWLCGRVPDLQSGGCEFES